MSKVTERVAKLRGRDTDEFPGITA
jgi:hypothetical protein